MSGTHHHRGQPYNHCGEDLWSRRPVRKTLYTAFNKRQTRRMERARDRMTPQEALNVARHDDLDYCEVCQSVRMFTPAGQCVVCTGLFKDS